MEEVGYNDKFDKYIDETELHLPELKQITNQILEKLGKEAKYDEKEIEKEFEKLDKFEKKNQEVELMKFQSISMAMRLGISELDVLEIGLEDRNEKRYFIYKYMKNLGKKIEKIDIVDDDYNKRFEYIGKEEMEIETYKTDIVAGL